MEFKNVTPWFLMYPKVKDKIRIFCFPYAGGGASIYREWVKAFHDDIGVYPIQLPGRESRINEVLMSNMEDLVREISKEIQPFLDKPFIFFGHSLGAKIAYELAKDLRKKCNLEPLHLIISGSRAPQITECRPIHNLPKDEFIKELYRFSGTSEEVLKSKEIMKLFMPILRADFTLDESYIYSKDKPFKCRITAFGGTEDSEVSREEIEAWKLHTNNNFTIQMFKGGHFFLKPQKELLLQAISKIINTYIVDILS